MSIGSNLLKYRNEKKLSQQNVADYLNVARQTISKWENDKALPSLETLEQLCSLYQVSIADLMDIKKEVSSTKDVYMDILNVFEKIQISNRKKKYLSYILVCLSLLSLFSSIFVYQNFTKYQNQLLKPGVYGAPEYAYYEYIFKEDDDFITLENNDTYLKINKIDLTKKEVFLEGRFILKKYTNDTKCSLVLNAQTEAELIYPLVKESENVFLLQCTIPFDNIYNVYLKIEDSNNQYRMIDIEEIASDLEMFRLVFNYHRKTSYFYIPVDATGRLQLDRLIYEPTFHFVEGIYEGEFLQEGTIEIGIFNKDFEPLLNETVPMGVKHEFILDKPLSKNSDIYFYIRICGNRENGGYSIEFFGRDSQGNPSYFTRIHNKNELFQIYPIELGE